MHSANHVHISAYAKEYTSHLNLKTMVKKRCIFTLKSQERIAAFYHIFVDIVSFNIL